MAGRTLVASGTNLLARGFLVVATDRMSPAKEPVNALFAVARSVHRALALRAPTRAVAVIDTHPKGAPAWPALLAAQLPRLEELFRALGFQVVVAEGEEALVASYAARALEAGEDVLVVGVDKRYAQLVGERCWWYDANKDVRYTTEIVTKRFGVPPAQIASFLALVGDDSGNEALPGIEGIGAKGAATLLVEHGSVAVALEKAESLGARLGKALRAAKEDEKLAPELARARLDRDRALPIPVEQLSWRGLEPRTVNGLYEQLGFKELLVAEAGALHAEACETAEDVSAALARLGAGLVAIHLVCEDPAPVRTPLAGIALANGAGEAAWVPAASEAFRSLVPWLEDARAPKVGHALVGARVELRRAGVALAGIVGDTAVASHMTQPSNWAPHDLEIVAKQVLGRALTDDDAFRGVGKQRKAWSAMSAGRVAEHAGRYADASAAVWKELGPGLDGDILADYLALAEVCAKMELTGLLLDPTELDRAEASFAEIEAELQADIDRLAGHAFNVASSKQLGTVLFEELGLPVPLRTKTGFSTSIEALERIEHAHPIVGLVLRWRALRRLRDNWIHSLRRAIDADGRVHARFDPARSFSGQLVSSNPDLGRVPGRTPEMARIRRAFVAPPGRLLVSVDFNQLGLHVLAHLTKDPALTEPLRLRADMHAATAAAILEKPPSEVTPDERQLGKVVNFATFAGQGASALADTLGVPVAEAKEYIARFDRHYALVRAFQDEQLRLARERGYIVTLAGRKWPIGDLASLDPLLRSYAERLARRATHEASVHDVSRKALLEADRAIAREGLDAKPLVQIHDEVLFDVAEGELARAARILPEVMKGAYALEVPLVAGVWAGSNWADLEPVPS